VKLFLSVIFGALVGVSGTFLHNGYRPIGLLVSLLALILGARLVRNMYLSKVASACYALGWILVIVRASTLGNGGEILIEANGFGNTFAFGGLALLAVSQFRRN
jgi:hypothetical protein